MTNLEKYIYQLRRIEEHRSVTAEKEVRKIYKELHKELNSYLADMYLTYSEDDMLTYGDLARVGMDARFLEEVEQRINDITPQVANQISNTVAVTYETCYDGMVKAVNKAAGNRELLKKAFESVSAVTPDVIKRAVENPVSGLTLKDTLEKHRKEIIYDIKRNIGIGLTNGDRYSTMAKRISESLDGDYKKSIRIVRTEAHRVRESGFNDAATDINTALKSGSSGYVMAKTWHTMNDERVRPNTVYKTKKGWKKGKKSKYNHEKMDGVTIAQDELFKLPSGATCMCPSQTGVAGEDINCRCYVSYDLVLASELTKVKDGKKTIEEAAQVEKQSKFTPAKSVAEAEQYARDNFAKDVSYKGATSLDNVNVVNSTLADLTEKYPIDTLSTLKVNGRLQKANARACYDELEIKKDYINSTTHKESYRASRIGAIEKYKTMLADAEATGRTDKAYSDYKTRIKRAIAELEKDLKYKRWSISDDTDSILDAIRATVSHEYGHIVADQYIGQINGAMANKAFSHAADNALSQKCKLIKEAWKRATSSGDIYELSRYAATNEYEFFAEAFAANEMGHDLPQYIKDMLSEVLKHE
jgi:hypothetical protein